MNTNTKSVSKVNAFFNKLKKYNSHNIIIYSNQENSLRDAILSDGRSNKVSKIDGELITVKPNIKVENFPYTGGIKHFEGSVSKNDDPIIKRIKENGGIVIGSTNMDEAAFGGDTSTSFYGRCINPNNKELSVGGSSGGSAAAIASGLVNFSIGTDTMGSIRIPASYCGIVGFKPSSSMTNNKDLILLSDTYDTIGFHSNNVFNINNLYKIINSSIHNCDYKPINNIKCLVPNQIFNNDINKDVIEGFKEALLKIGKNGINIEYNDMHFWEPNFHRKLLLKIVENEGAKNLKELLENKASYITEHLRNNLFFGKSIDKQEIKNIRLELEILKNQIKTIYKEFDLILMPTTPQNSFNIKDKPPENQANLTSLANIADLPAISLPYKNGGKTFHSLQVLASQHNDEFLLKTSSFFEKILQ
ncbi:MAG: amidase [Alphaproteobacteria bacterium]|nr:amidase [Alphaproteobacteria bacterium]